MNLGDSTQYETLFEFLSLIRLSAYVPNMEPANFTIEFIPSPEDLPRPKNLLILENKNSNVIFLFRFSFNYCLAEKKFKIERS